MALPLSFRRGADALPLGTTLPRDFTASIVVFLVAMPLCMGIAVASGMPPERGLVTGIIGGLIVGMFAGSPLQVSGPAAGLAVIVFEIVRDQGIAALGPILLVAGVIQVAAGLLRVGGWFRAISPAVVHGMLAGIGVLIVVGQFHVLFDDTPLPSGLQNLMAMPQQLLGLDHADIGATERAFAIGLLTIAAMLGWEKFRPASLRLVPGALVGVVSATLVAWIMGLDVARVAVPASIASAIALPDLSNGFLALFSLSIVGTAVAIAFIASAETLLSAAAVDRMHDGVRTDYNKELRAQGIGNLLCGVAGALPMTGVIVRSSANVQAGAMTRLSTILHGAWILGFVVLLPWLLREIPMAALAGVLVITGWRLVSISHATHMLKGYGILPAFVWLATLVLVVTTDLLTGVLAGIGLSLLELIPHYRHLRLRVDASERGDETAMALEGSATMIALPRLSAALEQVPAGRPVRLDLTGLRFADHATTEMLVEWLKRHRAGGARVELHGVSEKRHSRELAAAA